MTTQKWKPTVCLDFDGVLHSYTSGWKGVSVCPDPPVPGSLEFIARLINADYNVVVCSVRCNKWRGRRAIRRWLRKYCLHERHIKVVKGKPPAMLYIDDRAVQFKGLFPELSRVKSFAPWKVGDAPQPTLV